MLKTRRRISHGIVLTMATLLSISLPASSLAADAGLAPVVTTPPPGLLTPLTPAPTGLLTAAPGYILSNPEQSAIAPGVMLSSHDWLDAWGWVTAHVITVDLTNPMITADLLHPGTVAAAKPLDELAAQRGAVAGVNGDFFDIQGTKAPLSAEVAGGSLIKGPATGWPRVAGVGIDRVGRLAEMAVEGTVLLPGGAYPLTAVNQHLPENAIGLFNSLWGSTSRYLTAKWGQGIKEVTVRNGEVVAIADEAGSGEIPPDTVVLLGRETGAEMLATLKVGDKVSVQYAPRSTAGVPFWFAIGGDQVILKDGIMPTLDDQNAHPRTAIGFSADGRQMFLVAVDGRQSASRGMTMKQLALLMRELGAANALNLDGGGSTAMVARLPGDSAATVVNSPSERRPVANGVGLFARPGSGQLRQITIESLQEQPYADRIFPGLVRRFAARGMDESMAPVPLGNPSWRVSPDDSRLFLVAGMIQAGQTGPIRVEVEAGGIRGYREIQVLGALARLEAQPAVLKLDGAAGAFQVVGFDAEGYQAPVESANAQLEYDPSLLTITPNAAGGFDVNPKAVEGSTSITVKVADRQVTVPVSLGGKLTPLSDFTDPTEWNASAYPAGVGSALSQAFGRTGQGLRVAYDFSSTDATRAAYVDAVPGLPLPADASSLGLWVKGDGHGAWLRAVVVDGGGTSHTLDLARHVNWTDWQYVEAALPAGLAQPVTLQRIYPVEADAAAKYQGELILDDLAARSPAALPTRPLDLPEPDPMMVPAEAIQQENLRFAVLSHSLLAGETAKSPDAEALRERLRQIAEAEPAFLVLTGDMVTEPTVGRLTLLRQLLTAELGNGVPVYYLPGSQEEGSLALLRRFFPLDRSIIDRDGTRFILLNSATGSLRTSDFQQLVNLKASLEAAAKEAAVRNVVVFAHHATTDPLGGDHQLADRREAALVESLLSQFRAESGGKGIALIAGQPARDLAVRRWEGVRTVSVGADGWALFGVASPEAGDWLKAAEGPAD